MTYTDLILNLLKSRDGLICVEHHLLNDFKETDDPFKKFLQWCAENSIACQRIEDDNPPKLHLKKALSLN
jgi:hypothetical protein